jgi:hypothetical protein
MTEKEKKAKVEAFEKSYEEIKKHRAPSGQNDKIGLNIISYHKDKQLEVADNNKIPIVISSSPIKINAIGEYEKDTDNEENKNVEGLEI